MESFSDRQQRRLERHAQNQAVYGASSIQKQISAGDTAPYSVYVRVPGLDPESTAAKVGPRIVELLGDGYMLDAEVAEEESRIVRDGAVIRVHTAE